MAKPKLIGLDSPVPEGVDVKSTKMLEPGAREPSSVQSGTGGLKQIFGKKPSFGKLGARGNGAL